MLSLRDMHRAYVAIANLLYMCRICRYDIEIIGSSLFLPQGNRVVKKKRKSFMLTTKQRLRATHTPTSWTTSSSDIFTRQILRSFHLHPLPTHIVHIWPSILELVRGPHTPRHVTNHFAGSLAGQGCENAGLR